MSIDPFTGRNPSYCFVDFADPNVASQAMQRLRGALLRDRPLRINLRTEKRSRPRVKLPPTTSGDWRTCKAAIPNQDHSQYVFDRWKRHDARDHWFEPTDEGRRLYVGGLSKVADQEILNVEMKTLFKDWNILAVSKPNRSSENHQHEVVRRYCFVDFATAADAHAARRQLDGRPTACGGTYRIGIANHTSTRKVSCEQGAKPNTSSSRPGAKHVNRTSAEDWRAKA